MDNEQPNQTTVCYKHTDMEPGEVSIDQGIKVGQSLVAKWAKELATLCATDKNARLVLMHMTVSVNVQIVPIDRIEVVSTTERKSGAPHAK